MNQRKIIHVDMDAFYASIEQRDHPEYRGKPIAVGRPEMRGVVAAASYEARRFGVRSAMPSMKALKLCPQLIFTRNRMEVYKTVSAQIHAIFHRYTDLVEPLSLDEAFLDVTENKPGIPLAVDIARRIKKEIRQELRLTASAGVSYNKFLAKIASDYRKPDGLFTIHPSRAEKFIAALPIEAFWGVGRATAERMRALSITNGAQLRARDKDFLMRHFGKIGALFYNFARGVDDRPVEPSRIRKSVGCEETYRENVTREEAQEQHLPLLAEELARRLARAGFRGNTLTLKVKFPDFVQKTRCTTVPETLTEKEDILPLARTLMEELDSGDRTFRLLWLSVSHPQEEQRQGIWEQLWLDLEY
ncbi:DNA polymerase IV [uncultured Akkermansia sp.]|uniref:DNA polymerase IV n=1 Tax=uncultured Akkermansia sp. TaxID=512294 RepID=UPI00261ED890|nr:DNA polymerase IV [uncultured Akkermansia sp.]